MSIILAWAGNCGAMVFGPGGTGGGDEVGIDFVSSFNAAMSEIQANDPTSYAKLSAANIQGLVESAHVLVTDEELPVPKEGVDQKSVAVNIPSRELVVVNRARWSQIKNPYVKRGIALHEFASIRHLESTGRYPFSAAYIALHGIDASSLAGSGELDGTNDFSDAIFVPIKGAWTGQAFSESEGTKYLGALQLVLSTQTIPATAGRSGSDLITNLDFLSNSRYSTEAAHSFYEPATGVYQSQIVVTLMNANTAAQAVVNITAIISKEKGTMDGTIEAAGYPGFGIRFHLMHNGKDLQNIADQSGTPASGDSFDANLVGKIKFAGTTQVTKAVTMNLVKPMSTDDESFYNLLAPKQNISATFNFSTFAQLTFSNAVWDARSARLVGVAELDGPAVSPGELQSKVQVTMDCSKNLSTGTLTCRFMNQLSNATVAVGTLQPVASPAPAPIDNSPIGTPLFYTYNGSVTLHQLDPNNLGNIKGVTTYKIGFTVGVPATSPMDEINSLFEPGQQRVMNVSFAIFGTGVGDSFQSAKWDTSNGSIYAQQAFSTPAGLYANAYLSCTNFKFQDPQTSSYDFNCSYLSTLNNKTSILHMKN